MLSSQVGNTQCTSHHILYHLNGTIVSQLQVNCLKFNIITVNRKGSMLANHDCNLTVPIPTITRLIDLLVTSSFS